MTSNHTDQLVMWTRHSLTGVIGTWRGPRVPRGDWGVSAGAATFARRGEGVNQASRVNTTDGKPASRRPRAKTGKVPPKAVKTVPAPGRLGVLNRSREPLAATTPTLHRVRPTATNDGTPAKPRPSTGRRTSGRNQSQPDTTSPNPQVSAVAPRNAPKSRKPRAQFYDKYLWNAFSVRREINEAADAIGLPRPKVLWVLQAPMPDPQRDVPRRLNEIYTYAADLAGDRVTDAGATASMAAYPYSNLAQDRYEFTRYLPCTDKERSSGTCTYPEAFGGTARLRSDNDDIHFCLDGAPPVRGCPVVSPGIGRYVDRIAADAKAWLASGN
ncbi:hypothetical protein [Actinokineospora sp. HUAS TT18]|uniref:hypothetical protein n=1 Tax=Actinokineospora sp. HUAS TT18 TaxID=3447451 RepID=UPI003F527FBE